MMKLSHAGALFLRQPELVTQLKDMDMAQVPIEFRWQGQAHAAARAAISSFESPFAGRCSEPACCDGCESQARH